ncbi:MAG: hypothetical protein ABW023_12755 [Sphingomonas sp.]
MIVRPIALAIVLGALFLAFAGALRFAGHAGWLAPDQAEQIVQVAIGLGLAAYANLMPKRIGRMRGSPEAERRSQAALRVGGRAMVLAGLAFAGFSAFAPTAFRGMAAMACVATALVVTLGYAWWTFTACRMARKASIS